MGHSERKHGPRRRDRDAPAAAQVRRSRRATAAASCRRSTGSRGGRENGRPVDWFYYVNGDRVGRRRRRRASSRRATACGGTTTTGARRCAIPAVVGSFPEPFTSAARGKKIPIRIDCADDAVKRRATRSGKRLEAAGALVGGTGTVGTRAGPEVLRLLVGRWTEVRARPDRRADRAGAEGLGRVRAAEQATASAIALLDSRGRTVRTLGAGAGLVAATQLRSTRSRPGWSPAPTTWASRRRRRRWSRTRLEDHFAVAVAEGPGGADPAAGRHDGGAVTYRRRSSPAARRASRGRLACTAWCWRALRSRSSTR